MSNVMLVARASTSWSPSKRANRCWRCISEWRARFPRYEVTSQYSTPSRMPLQATNRKLYSASKRLLDERQPLEGFSNDITRASHGPDQRGYARWVDFLAQATDVYIDQVGAGIEVVAPDFLENHHAGDDLAAVAHHELQQLVFGRQQVQRLLATAGFATDQVQLQVRDTQHGFGLGHRVATTQQDFNPCGHFIRGERFGQVVIAPGTQATDTFIDIGKCTDHQNRSSDAQGAQRRDDGQAIHFRQHAVQGNQVVTTTDCADQAFTAIVYPVHVESVTA